MGKKIILGIFLLMLGTTEIFSQSVIRNFLYFQDNMRAEEFFSWSNFASRMARHEGFHEISDQPNYVWQDISQQLRRYYGNRSPRVGDVFEYRGQFTDRTDFWIFFRIEQVEGTNVTRWTVRRWRNFI